MTYPLSVLLDAARNHRSWFGRGRERIDLDGVTVFLGDGDAVLAFPEQNGDLSGAVQLARDSGAREVGCWTLEPDDHLDAHLSTLGFQCGWQPHWMGVDPGADIGEPGHEVVATTSCSRDLPYWSPLHEAVLGGAVHHLVVRDGPITVGHVILNVDAETGGMYDMGVAPQCRSRGYGRALTLAALALARQEGCVTVTLNATADGEPIYQKAGFESLGLGMTWWLFPRAI